MLQDRYQNLDQTRPPWTKTGVCGPSTCPLVHVDNGPEFVLRLSISWTNSDAGPTLSFQGRRVDGFLTMDRPLHGRIRTTHDKKILPDGRRWTGKRMKQTDGWTDNPPVSYLCYRWTDGQKSVRRGLVHGTLRNWLFDNKKCEVTKY